MTTEQKIKTCPRCGGIFECRPNDPTQCQCSSVTLSAEQVRVLRKSYTDCLCIRCLTAIAAHRADS